MENLDYEQAAKELDQILADLKTDTISIDKLAEKVERAAKLATFCSQKLRTTEGKIKEIVEKLGL
ncbi:exodeoxyribonuclease VII small subunit [Maribellus sp. CM-23]|uniref:exodeoxyribonuclease VII small subunit n=1 Tax=Maribellus sp. CM-23 TaxID=2781026 RepID=UPI001F335E4A|nr:exodeoxyribonuclease VII small subunit [Maribellus sp. CM-23]MCE4566027.1 exodeoxyribonuclease VII small subunit [Maribellus sp. CM-23]